MFFNNLVDLEANMNDGILNIQKEDVLWRFYRKAFQLEGREVERPKNFCHYFSTAMSGFKLWLYREAHLGKMWMVVILIAVFGIVPATYGMIYVGDFFGDRNATAFPTIIMWVLWWAAVFFLTMAGMWRAIDYLNKRFPWLENFVMVCLGVVSVVFFAVLMVSPESFQFSWTDLWRELTFALKILLAVGVVLIALNFLDVVFPRCFPRVLRTLQSFRTFVVAKKNRFCPKVNPPEEWNGED